MFSFTQSSIHWTIMIFYNLLFINHLESTLIIYFHAGTVTGQTETSSLNTIRVSLVNNNKRCSYILTKRAKKFTISGSQFIHT